MWWTLTDVGALRVDTITVLASLWIFTFVNIRTVSTGFIKSEALVADTAEHSVNVFAFSKHAKVTKHLTFVDI